MKMIRWVMLWRQGSREIVRLVHPKAIIPVTIGGRAMQSRVIQAVWGFFAAYVLCFGVPMVALLATGEDQVTAYSAIATCIHCWS
jgi:trk system potassium uptake protein